MPPDRALVVDDLDPGMVELNLVSNDVYGAVVAVNFTDLTWRCALTDDFATLRPIGGLDELTDLTWWQNITSDSTRR